MAYETGNPPPEAAADDLYSDGEDSGAEAPKEEAKQEDSPAAVLPKSILAGKTFNVGDEVVLKITGMHGDEVTVEYAPAKKGEKEEEPDEDDEAPRSDGGADELYE